MSKNVAMVGPRVYQNIVRFYCLMGEELDFAKELGNDRDRISDDVMTYGDIIETSDEIWFWFDAKQFVEDDDYRQEVWDQIHFFNRKAEEKAEDKIRNDRSTLLTITAFCPRDNKYADDENLANKIYELSKGKEFRGLFALECVPKSGRSYNAIVLFISVKYVPDDKNGHIVKRIRD